jgi:nicotinamide riboside kinase
MSKMHRLKKDMVGGFFCSLTSEILWPFSGSWPKNEAENASFLGVIDQTNKPIGSAYGALRTDRIPGSFARHSERTQLSHHRMTRLFDMSKKCIYVVGPQSTGKTTLVNALAEKLGHDLRVIKEVARQVMQEKGYTREDVDSDDRERRFSMQKDIFNAQLRAENKILDPETNACFLSDRSAIDPVVYLRHYSGHEESSRITSTSDWRRTRKRYADSERSLIVLLLPVMEFLVDDDIRYVPKSHQDWRGLATTFQTFMKEEGIPTIQMGEECFDIEERIAVVLEQIGVDLK